VQHGTQGFRVEGMFEDEQIVCKWKEGKKTIEHNASVYEKVTGHIGKYCAVMIAPDDIELINEGGEMRRKFVDGLLSQSDAAYLDHLLLYQKFLAQRNAYLKQTAFQNMSHDLLDVYDEHLSRHGAYLIREREKLSLKIPELVQEYYAVLSDDAEQVGMQYKRCAEPQMLFSLLQHSRQRDMEYKRTLNGPHTEDWLFKIGDNPLKAHASQGQKKSFLISLKMLDDIFEKLDRKRLSQLFAMLQKFSLSQIFLTHTSAQDMMETVSKYYDNIQLIEL
jgi:DNA replication and repair protein RecF